MTTPTAADITAAIRMAEDVAAGRELDADEVLQLAVALLFVADDRDCEHSLLLAERLRRIRAESALGQLVLQHAVAHARPVTYEGDGDGKAGVA